MQRFIFVEKGTNFDHIVGIYATEHDVSVVD